ncbi:MAG: hypothetical protein LBV50_04720, partial [Novosphingobium sp.]|nr:hypothetical protein [Novosphingobium sp.]
MKSSGESEFTTNKRFSCVVPVQSEAERHKYSWTDALILALGDQPLGYVGAGVACLILGLSVGTEVDCCACLAARHSGLKSFGALFGMMNGLMLFGNGIRAASGWLVATISTCLSA